MLFDALNIECVGRCSDRDYKTVKWKFVLIFDAAWFVVAANDGNASDCLCLWINLDDRGFKEVCLSIDL